MKEWQIATLIEAKMVADNVKSLTFLVDEWREHAPGQHYDIRLTAASGYQAQRSYSAASAPEQRDLVEFGIQILENGEVSPYLFALQLGQKVELRGPIGGHFVWNTKMPGPLVLIGGGSGMVPLMSMLRHHLAHVEEDKAREIIFLISARTQAHILYKEELEAIAKKYSHVKIVITLTQEQSPSVSYSRLIDRQMFEEVFGHLLDKMPMMYICGPTAFVEVAGNLCVEMGFNEHAIRTERFGGSGK